MLRNVVLWLSLGFCCACATESDEVNGHDGDDVVEPNTHTEPQILASPPVSFHFVFQSSLRYWDAVLGLVQTRDEALLVSQNKPPQINSNRWVAYLSYRSNPRPTAATIHALLSDPQHAPRMVMLEELHDRASAELFAELATAMRTQYPQWEGRWGVFVSYANYPLLATGIDAMLRANAVLALQLYPRKSAYCASASTAGARDVWLAEQIVGNASLGRLRWLLARREGLGSKSRISPLLGVGDVLLGDSNAAIFLDRIFYVWVTRTGYRNLILAANGGPGAYKWQSVAETPERYGVTSDARDEQFAASFAHYSVAGKTRSRLGPVSCP
jgi:hypothetical protein